MKMINIEHSRFCKEIVGKRVIVRGYVQPFTVTLARVSGDFPLTLRQVEGDNIRNASCRWEDVVSILPS